MSLGFVMVNVIRVNLTYIKVRVYIKYFGNDEVCLINKCLCSIETASINDRFNQSFAKVRVSLTSATLPSYFFHPLFAFLSIG